MRTNYEQHGLSHTKLYGIWKAMRKRVNNKNTTCYKNYGGRGIEVCERWKLYTNFHEDMSISYRAGLTLDRIDNEKGYSKENCKWATRMEQSRNRRNVPIYNYKKESMTVGEYAKKYGIKMGTLQARLKNKNITEAIKMGPVVPKYYYMNKRGAFIVCVTKGIKPIRGGQFKTEQEAQKKVEEILKELDKNL